MITLFTGAPGSGKSAACVSLLSGLAAGRTIYANGIPDLGIAHEVLDDPTKWHQTVPDGSIIVIDEVQRIWRPRGPGQKVPDDIQALETHRHRGIDFYIITQGPRLVDSNIRALTGRHVHLRDVGILGRYWYEWPECADNCATAWKNAPIKKRYRLPKAAFALYKSASVHIKPIRSIPWMLAVMVLALVITAAVTYRAYTSISGKLAPTASAPAATLSDLKSPVSSQNSEPSPVDLVASFEPQIPGLAYTAPRYAEITKPTTAPYPAACLSMGSRCNCYTQQGTTLDVPSAICLQIVKGGFFLDWMQPQAQDVQAKGKPLDGNPGQSSAPAVASASEPPGNVRAINDGQVLASMAASKRGPQASSL
jgi:zona occludens toxin